MIGLYLLHPEVMLVKEVEGLAQEGDGVVDAEVVVDADELQAGVFIKGGVLVEFLPPDGVEVLDVDLEVGPGERPLIALVLSPPAPFGAGIEAQATQGFIEATDTAAEAMVSAEQPVEAV